MDGHAVKQDYDAILHVGAGKSGSSAIQTFLRENVTALQQRGFTVPAQDLAIRTTISGHSVFKLQEFFDNDGSGVFFHLDRAKRAAGDNCLLISAENMSNADNFRYFRKFGSEYNVKVIFYIRRQDDFLASAWQQWASKIRGDLNEWLAEACKSQADWNYTISGWESVVGEGNVIPRIFERQSLPQGDVVRDFIETLGFSPDEFSLPEGDVNASFDNLITLLVQGRKDLFDGAHDEAFYRFVTPLQGERRSKSLSLVSRTQREKIIRHHAAGNEAIREKFFPEKESLFSPLRHDKYQYSDEIDLRSEQIGVLLEIVANAFKRSKEQK